MSEWLRLVFRPPEVPLAGVSEPAPERLGGEARSGGADLSGGELWGLQDVGLAGVGGGPEGGFGAEVRRSCLQGRVGKHGEDEFQREEGDPGKRSPKNGCPARAHNTGIKHAGPLQRSSSRAVAGTSSFVSGLSGGEGGKAVGVTGSCWRKGGELRDREEEEALTEREAEGGKWALIEQRLGCTGAGGHLETVEMPSWPGIGEGTQQAGAAGTM